MAGEGRRRGTHVDADGVRTERLGSIRSGTWLVLAVIAALCIVLLVAATRAPRPSDATAARSLPPREGRPPAPPAGPDADARRAAPPPRAIAPPLPPPARREAPAPPADADTDADAPTAFGAGDTEQPSGMALFPPMGSEPIKRGYVVPDGFELPPGYMRYHQVSDDGEDVPPILMFHPDYHPVDEHGDPIALPADRVVPREMVPPGMPMQMLELPDDQAAPDAAP